MASRTNKKWIAQKKAQLEKQAKRLKWAKRFEYPKRNISIEMAKELWIVWWKTNPKWRTNYRFLRWRKICWETRMRMDHDWYKLVKVPSWWLEFVEVMLSWWSRKKLIKNTKKK